MLSKTELLAGAEQYLLQEVRPNAEAIDFEPQALRQALEGLQARNLLCLRRPQEFGGPQLNELEFRQYQETVARASGALAFLQTQHQSAIGMLAKSTNQAAKEQFLTYANDRLIGIGFSQLRRAGNPLVQATPAEKGYVINGFVPWVTGYSFFPEFMVAATLPDGQSVFGIVPFKSDAGLELSDPMELAAMQAAQTVTARFTDYVIPQDRVVDVKPPRWIFLNDQVNITLQGFFAIGCARAGIDVVREAASRKGLTAISDAADKLEAEVDLCRARMIGAQAAGGEETTQEKLELRAWAIELSMRCAHAGIAATGGASAGSNHPAQRILREALIFTVSAQTESIMEATLDRLVR